MANQEEMDNTLSGPVDVLEAQVERARAESRWWKFADSADEIADSVTRGHVTALIYSAGQNATDTIDVEGEAADSEWESLAKGSLRSLLDCGGDSVTDAVIAWFVDASRKEAA